MVSATISVPRRVVTISRGSLPIAEQCSQYHECGSYVDHYGSHVLAVEYHDTAFRRACRNWADQIAVVRRDVNLTRHGTRRWC